MLNKTVFSVYKGGKGCRLAGIRPGTAAPASLVSAGFGVRPPAHMCARMSAHVYARLSYAYAHSISDIMFAIFEIIFGELSKCGKPHLEVEARIKPGS